MRQCVGYVLPDCRHSAEVVQWSWVISLDLIVNTKL